MEESNFKDGTRLFKVIFTSSLVCIIKTLTVVNYVAKVVIFAAHKPSVVITILVL